MRSQGWVCGEPRSRYIKKYKLLAHPISLSEFSKGISETVVVLDEFFDILNRFRSFPSKSVRMLLEQMMSPPKGRGKSIY